MIYQKFQPAETLKSFVECYFTWQSSVFLEKEINIESPPNGFCSLVINSGDPYQLSNKKYERLQVPSQFVAGQSIYSYRLHLRGRIDMAGIVFKPAALATLFGLNAFELAEERTELFQVLQLPYMEKYVTGVRTAEDNRTKANWLEALLLHHCGLSRPTADYIDEAANRIVEGHGMIHINDLLADSCMSRRTFERRFFQKVGLSPKYFARIRRISYVCNLVAGRKKVNWADVFYELEFYDQAHFIKDFEEFTGRTPRQYLMENTELANFVEKPRLQSL